MFDRGVETFVKQKSRVYCLLQRTLDFAFHKFDLVKFLEEYLVSLPMD